MKELTITTKGGIVSAVGYAALAIANMYYSSPRYIKDKDAIANTLRKNIYINCATIVDDAIGRVWVVEPVGEYRYAVHKAL